MRLDLSKLHRALENVDPVQVRGRVTAVVGLGIRAQVPGLRIGEIVEIERPRSHPLRAEVVGFHQDEVMLIPLGTTDGIAPDDTVVARREPFAIRCSTELLGRVLDGLGEPMDGLPPVDGELWNVMRPSPNPLTRAPIHAPLALGIRAIDGLLTMGQGQRVGLFAGSGVGKSTLLGQITRQADADVFVVNLVGERGREVREFLEESLGEEGRKRSVIVCATSDAPALIRMKSVYVATAIAEWFREQGKRVFLLVDSITRFARAAREVGLAAGEPPARRGFPASVFATLPTLLERSGNSERGSMTAFYTVLVEGSDMEEPIADEVRGILDGHIVLERALGQRGRWPAIDVLQSVSRLMDSVTSESHRNAAQRIREHLAIYEEKRDLVLLGAYKIGTDSRLDAALDRIEAIEKFLRQGKHESSSLEETRTRLEKLAR